MPEVTIQTFGNTTQIQLFLNGIEVISGGQEPHTSLQYDFNEIRVPTGFLDLEDVQTNPAKYIDYDYEAVLARIEELKAKLLEKDYVGTKIAMGRATREEYADVIAQCDAWADEINRLENGGVL